MKRLLVILLFSLLILNVNAQLPLQRATEIGIIEKLGETIPLDLRFVNEKNDTVTLGSLINKPTILSFVYFDCPGLCGRLLEGISEVVGTMDLSLGKDYDIITISFNDRDTPEKARIKKLNFDQKINENSRASWTFLTGSFENIHKITEATGFRYKPTGLDFAHPAGIIMLSPKGKITRYLYGTSFLPFDVKMAVVEAQKGIAQPTSSKLLDYCFAYDPQSRGYTLQVTRVLGTFVLILGLFFVAYLVISGRKNSPKVNKE